VHPRRSRTRRRGAALILVVLVVAALLAIGAPFVLSMRHTERAGRTAAAATRARLLARGAQARALARLLEEHEDSERRARERRVVGADEDVDDLEDVLACGAEPETPAGVRPFAPAGPTGAWSTHVDVVDLRARLDPLTAPRAVAHLLGVTISTAPLSWDEARTLEVEDARCFHDDGDPSTLDGLVCLGGELIAYRERVELRAPRGAALRWELRGLVRRTFFTGEPPPKEADDRRHYHPVGTLVEDGRFVKLAADPLRRPREVGEDEQPIALWSGVASLRRTSDWSLGAVNARSALRGAGVTARELRQWGISRELLVAAGLEPEEFDFERRPGGDTQATRQLERALEGLDVPVESLWRLGGQRALQAAHQQLSRLEPERRRAQASALRAEISASLVRCAEWYREWLRDEARRQLPSIARLREEVPDLETIGRIELERDLRPFVTTDAPPLAAAWSEWFLAHVGPLDPLADSEQLRLLGSRGVATGALVRVRPRGGGAEAVRRVHGVNDDQAWIGGLPLAFARGEPGDPRAAAEVSARLPTPVCVRTAPREVLEALLTGLRGQVGQEERRPHEAMDVVTPREARAITDALLRAPPRDLFELRALLGRLHHDEVISLHDREAVLLSAVDPAHPHFHAQGAVPLCFTTGEVYEVKAAAAVVDDAGVELARAATREVVRAAPPVDLVWSIDTQAEWADRLWTEDGDGLDPFGGTAPALLLPHARSAFVETGPVYLGPLLPRGWARPSSRHAAGEAQLRPLRGVEPRCEKGEAEPGPGGSLRPGALRQDDWADLVDGVALASQAVPATQLPRRRLEPTESQRPQDVLGPGGLRGWFRLDRPAGPGRQFLLDGGLADGVDRLSLFLEGGELVLAADDEALDARESAALGLARPRATEVRWRPARPFEAGEWHHVAAQWRGADRGDLALVVDGQLVGKETHGALLDRPVDAFAGRLVLDDARGLPPSGLVRVDAGRYVQSQGQERGFGEDRELPRDRGEVVGELLRYERIEGDTLVLATGPPLQGAAGARLAQGWKVASIEPPLPLPLPLACRLPLRGSGRAYTVTLVGPRRGREAPETESFEVMLGATQPVATHVGPFGYRSLLERDVADPDHQSGRLTRGGATLVDPLPETTPTTLLYARVEGYGQADPKGERQLFPQVVDSESPTIPVLWAGAYPDPPSGPAPREVGAWRSRPAGLRGGPNLTGGWPDQGVVRITTRPQPTIDANGRPATPSSLSPSVERVRYTGIDRARGLLLGCTRGIEGTSPAPHCLFDSVVLESVRVTDPTDYPRRPTLDAPRVLVSLAQRAGRPDEAVEWLSVQRCQDGALERAGLLLLPARETLNAERDPVLRLGEGEWVVEETPPLLLALVRQLLALRGDLGPSPGTLTVDDPNDAEHGQPWKEVLKRWEPTRARAARRTKQLEHPAGTKLVPTFVLREQDWGEAGAGDVVTITDDREGGAPAREEARVVHAVPTEKEEDEPDAGATDRGSGHSWLVAFDDFVSRAYLAEEGARLARWPVGDLRSVPDLVLGRASPTARRDAPGLCEGRLDDLVVWQDEEEEGSDSIGAPPDGPALSYRPAHQPPAEGLVKVDDEVLDLRSVRSVPRPGSNDPSCDWVEAEALRGALGTRPAAHAPGTQGWRLTWPGRAWAAYAPDPFGRVQLREARGDLQERWGYAAVDRGANGRTSGPWAGVLAYDADDRSSLQLPVDHLGARCFPAAFGTTAVEPVAGDLLVDLPHRVHDRPAATTRSFEGVLWQAAREVPGGYLLKVDWDESLPTPYAEVRVAVRVDGAPAWDGPRATAPGQTGVIHVLDDPRAPNLLLLPCERVEVRVTLTFKPGALEAGAWKRGAVLSALRVHYRQATRTLRAEEGE
jgi:hypothetical protein